MTTKTVDEWCAAQCGVEFINNRYGWFWYPQNHAITEEIESVKWTIQDPRCREIVREHFRIYTYPTKYSKDIGNDGIWSAYQDGGGHIARERTISKAEIGCITAIYEASQ